MDIKLSVTIVKLKIVFTGPYWESERKAFKYLISTLILNIIFISVVYVPKTQPYRISKFQTE